jgi:hypothetical protein
MPGEVADRLCVKCEHLHADGELCEDCIFEGDGPCHPKHFTDEREWAPTCTAPA